jgi:hypothetical protein
MPRWTADGGCGCAVNLTHFSVYMVNDQAAEAAIEETVQQVENEAAEAALVSLTASAAVAPPTTPTPAPTPAPTLAPTGSTVSPLKVEEEGGFLQKKIPGMGGLTGAAVAGAGACLLVLGACIGVAAARRRGTSLVYKNADHPSVAKSEQKASFDMTNPMASANPMAAANPMVAQEEIATENEI